MQIKIILLIVQGVKQQLAEDISWKAEQRVKSWLLFDKYCSAAASHSLCFTSDIIKRMQNWRHIRSWTEIPSTCTERILPQRIPRCIVSPLKFFSLSVSLSLLILSWFARRCCRSLRTSTHKPSCGFSFTLSLTPCSRCAFRFVVSLFVLQSRRLTVVVVPHSPTAGIPLSPLNKSSQVLRKQGLSINFTVLFILSANQIFVLNFYLAASLLHFLNKLGPIHRVHTSDFVGRGSIIYHI